MAISEDIRASLATTRAEQPRYSCVMADAPRFAQQTLTLVWTLLDLAQVPPSRILVHALQGGDASVRRQLDALGIETRACSPFDPAHPHCNKLRQLEDTRLWSDDVAVLCDTDIAFVSSIDDALSSATVRAKIVDLPNPPMEVWRAILTAAALPRDPFLTTTSFGEHTTPSINCNGGVYALPGWAVEALSTAWPRWTSWLIARPALLPGPMHVHVDQVAFGLAMLDLGLAIDLLPLEYNLPTHTLVGPLPDVDPRVLHYHDRVDASGFLTPVGHPRVDAAVARVNEIIRHRRRQGFDNASFWDFRYRTAPDLGSGVGSRGANLGAKRALLTAIVRPEDTVLDVGCGDLEVSRHLPVSVYTGVDLSVEALALARGKRPDWTFHPGDLHDLSLSSHDVVVCFDVLIHQRTRAAYRSLLAQLVRLTRRTLVVSAYNQPPWHTSEITFFHEPLTTSLGRLVGLERLDIVSGYRDTTVVQVALAPDDRTPLVDVLRTARVYETATGRFASRPDDLISTQFEAFGGHTRNELSMLVSLLEIGDVVLDVGAHIGSFAIPMARRVGAGGLVVAVEPDASNLELLYQNAWRNGVAGHVTVVEGVVSNRPGPVRAVIDATNTGALYFVDDSDPDAQATVSIDTIVSNCVGGRRVRLLKIDVEGMELAALRSATATIATSRPIIYCEVVPAQLARQAANTGDLARFFADHHYVLYRNRGDRNSTHDRFDIVRLSSLAEGGAFFDCLAVPAEDVQPLVTRGQLPS